MPETNYEAVLRALQNCREKAAAGSLSLGEAFGTMKESGFCFVCILLCLPFIQPISIGPLATIGGLTFAWFGWQMMRGHDTPNIPAKVAAISLPAPSWNLLLTICQKILGIFSKFTRPRLAQWVEGERGLKTAGLLIFIAGLLMAVPFVGIPFNNTLPALVILSACVALLEKDGVMFLVAVGWMIVTLLYFALLLALMFFFGMQIKAWLEQYLPSFLI
jgi:hypothetical protein